MIVRTLIFSKKAKKIAEMLPGAKSQGWICYDYKGDIRATKTATGLVDLQAFIIGPFWCGFIVAVLLVSAVVNAFLFGFIIRHQIVLDPVPKATNETLIR